MKTTTNIKKETDKKTDEMMSKEELDEYIEKHKDIPQVEMYINGKEVFPDEKHYDSYSSASGVGILQYANGKAAGYTDNSNIRYKIIY